MDMIPGPRVPLFAHVEIPYLCGDSPFPKPEDFTGPCHQRLGRFVTVKDSDSEHPLIVLDTKSRPVSKIGPTFYDVREQDPMHPKFRPLRDDYLSDEVIDAAVKQTCEEHHVSSSEVMYRRIEDAVEVVRDQERDPRSLELRSGTPGQHHWIESRCTGFYDGLGFEEFPDRWNLNMLRTRRLRNAEEGSFTMYECLAAQLQAWLFFGLLSEFLGKLVVPEDFIVTNASQKPIITLQKLVTSQEYRSLFGRLKMMPPEAQNDWAKRVVHALNIARQLCQSPPKSTLATWKKIPFAEEIFLSVRTIGDLIEATLKYRMPFQIDLEHFRGNEPWGRSPLIEARMLNQKISTYCKSDIARLMAMLPARAMYYISSLTCFRAQRHQLAAKEDPHQHCDDQNCVVDQVDDNTYQPLHVPGCEGCEMIGPSVGELEDILRSGSYPIVCIELDKDSAIRVRTDSIVPRSEHDKKTYLPYIAVSHVWAQGMGNPRGNNMHICQLLDLQRAAHRCLKPIKFYPDQEDDPFADWSHLFGEIRIHFWIDTLCVPADGQWRKPAILGMKDVYREALAVLVYDTAMATGIRGSTGISCQNRSPEECAAIILNLPWFKRIWTYQEAVLAKRLLFNFLDGPLDLYNMVIGLADRLKILRFPMPTYVSHEELPKYDDQITEYYNEMQALIRDSDEQWQKGTGPMSIRSPVDDVAFDLIRPLADLLGANERTRKLRFHSDQAAAIREAIRHHWTAASRRTTTHERDKSICLAVMLDLDATGLLDCESEVERAERFYEMLPGFPDDILFSGNPKLSKVGLRWADRDLLTFPLPERPGDTWVSFSSFLDQNGLNVSAPGFLVTRPLSSCTSFDKDAGSLFFQNINNHQQWMELAIDHCIEGPALPTSPLPTVAVLFQDTRASHPELIYKVFGPAFQLPPLSEMPRRAVLAALCEDCDLESEGAYSVRAEMFGVLKSVEERDERLASTKRWMELCHGSLEGAEANRYWDFGGASRVWAVK